MFWTPIQIVRGPTFIVFAFFSAVSLRFLSNSLDFRSTRSRELLLKHTWTPMCGCRSLVCKPKRKAFLCHKVRGLPTLIDSGLVHGTTQKIPGNRASRIIKSRPSMTCRLPYQQKSYEIMATLVKRRSFLKVGAFVVQNLGHRRQQSLWASIQVLHLGSESETFPVGISRLVQLGVLVISCRKPKKIRGSPIFGCVQDPQVWSKAKVITCTRALHVKIFWSKAMVVWEVMVSLVSVIQQFTGALRQNDRARQFHASV